jgi:hypothetical protein
VLRNAFSRLFGKKADPVPVVPESSVVEISIPTPAAAPLDLGAAASASRKVTPGGQTPAQALARRLATAAAQTPEQPVLRPSSTAPKHDPLRAAKASAAEISKGAAKSVAPEPAKVTAKAVKSAAKAAASASAGTGSAKSTDKIVADLAPLKDLAGFLGTALADSGTSTVLFVLNGAGGLDTTKAAQAFGDVVRAKLTGLKAMKLDDKVEDIVTVLGKQYHIIRPLAKYPELYLYLALDRDTGNLVLARARLKAVEESARVG